MTKMTESAVADSLVINEPGRIGSTNSAHLAVASAEDGINEPILVTQTGPEEAKLHSACP
jgi:hypothetical protein